MNIRNSWKTCALSFGIIVVLAACGAQATPTRNAQELPTRVPSATSTVTATVAATATVTTTRTPTNTAATMTPTRDRQAEVEAAKVEMRERILRLAREAALPAGDVIVLHNENDTLEGLYLLKDRTRMWGLGMSGSWLYPIQIESKVNVNRFEYDILNYQLTDGTFWYAPHAERWFSAPQRDVLRGPDTYRKSELQNWADGVAITGFENRLIALENGVKISRQEFIRTTLKAFALKLSIERNGKRIPDYARSTDPRLRVEPLMLGDPARFLPLVGEIRFSPTTAASTIWAEREKGIMNLNLDLLKQNYDAETLRYLVVAYMVKEASGIALNLLTAEDPCNNPDAVLNWEWNSNIPFLFALEDFAERVPAQRKTFTAYRNYIIKNYYQKPENFPACKF